MVRRIVEFIRSRDTEQDIDSVRVRKASYTIPGFGHSRCLHLIFHEDCPPRYVGELTNSLQFQIDTLAYPHVLLTVYRKNVYGWLRRGGWAMLDLSETSESFEALLYKRTVDL